jgi:glutamine---fructose-6-phosphate transaminase (isomerizing)
MDLRTEILEQPEVLAQLLETQMAQVERIAKVIRERDIEYVFVAARGTSSHAGVYAQYLWGTLNGLAVAMSAPSIFTIYDRPPHVKKALVIGISQSGQSPDIVQVVQGGARQGALTLAVTNDPSSPLARAADLVLDIHAGNEQAVAATKTYTAQLMALAMLSVALEGSGSPRLAELARVPEIARQVLAQEEPVARVAARYEAMHQCVVLGRGYGYATALEWSLKLKELAYVVAVPYSTAEFQHGPIALIAERFPVLAIAPRDESFEDVRKLCHRLRYQHGADLLVVSEDPEALALGNHGLRLPQGTPAWLAPLVTILPAQLFCYHLTELKGYDSLAPRGLHKVTLTH